MPHLILEFSANIAEDLKGVELLQELNTALSETLACPVNAIKSRIKACEEFAVGDGKTENVFIHLEVGLLRGRSVEEKSALSEVFEAILKRYFAKTLSEKAVSLTTEYRDINPETYQKFSVIE